MANQYRVIVARTQFFTKVVEADSQDEAIDLAWETDPLTWEDNFLSDECEQHDAVIVGSDFDYFGD
jgi:hypothetical protein